MPTHQPRTSQPIPLDIGDLAVVVGGVAYAGTIGRDTISGSERSDVVLGFGSEDSLRGRAGMTGWMVAPVTIGWMVA